MSRRHSAEKREVIPDAKYGDTVLAKFMNSIMYDGKKSAAEQIVYGAFDIVEAKAKVDPLGVFKQALENVAPAIEVRSRRVGGATYQVPIEVRGERKMALAMRWLIASSRKRPGGRSMAEKLAAELMDTAAGQSATTRKKDETHKMADANKAFAHYSRF